MKWLLLLLLSANSLLAQDVVPEKRRQFVFDPVTTDWTNRVRINGASVLPSLSTMLAVNTFVVNLKSEGVWSKLHMVNCVAWDGSVAIANDKIFMKTPQLVGCGIDPWSDTGCANGDFTINGFIGESGQYINPFNGSSSLISGCIASANSASMIVYVYLGSAVSSFDWGMSDTANGIIVTSYYLASDFAQGYVANIAHPASTAAGRGVLNGYYCATRTSSSRMDLYFANATHAHSSVANDTTANTFTLSTLHSMPICTLNNNGDISSFKNSRTDCFFALGDGLTASDSSNLNNEIVTMRTSFGGGNR
jgi:hypothetical protein